MNYSTAHGYHCAPPSKRGHTPIQETARSGTPVAAVQPSRKSGRERRHTPLRGVAPFRGLAPFGGSTLNILYYNARSLIPKLDELRLECVNRQPDIVCIVETWLDDTVSGNELLLPDYQIYRYDRNRHGGGVAIYVHVSLSCKIVLEGGPHKLEFLSLSVLSDSFSITKGQLPRLWKTASVVPIPKSSNSKHSPSGHRPISLLPIVSKLLEKHIHSLIFDYLNEHAPISDVQWGFQQKKSTVTALLSVTQDWLALLDQRRDTHCVFFDLQKAFDTVPHRKLMCKLEKLHLHPVLLTWLHNYLYGREQNVIVNGETSDPVKVISGVPQGSVLGPLLFLIYIDDITSLQLSEGTKVSLYADDMLLYKPISSDNDYVELQHDIDQVHLWSRKNGMQFNITKCKCMLLSRKRTSAPPALYLNTQPMEVVQSYKYWV